MNKKLLSSAIALALGISAPAWANPTNNSSKGGDQTATANSTQQTTTLRRRMRIRPLPSNQQMTAQTTPIRVTTAAPIPTTPIRVTIAAPTPTTLTRITTRA